MDQSCILPSTSWCHMSAKILRDLIKNVFKNMNLPGSRPKTYTAHQFLNYITSLFCYIVEGLFLLIINGILCN